MMGYEIDFLPVGEGSSGGDAIALRYGNLEGQRSEQLVMVVDGGYNDSGQALVDHIRTHYGTDVVDVVVSTHPDRDHISGLTPVLEQLTVRCLLMHLPWKHSDALTLSKSAGFKSLSFNEKLEKSMQATADLEELAIKRGVRIVEPFAGNFTSDSQPRYRVLGPSKEYYEELLPTMITAPSVSQRLSSLITKATEAARNFLDETLHIETLRDGGVTRPSNNSSVIGMLEVDGQRALLTGDAGIPALERALDVLESEGFVPGSIGFVQVPHHGSRRNVGPSVLNRLLGPVGQENSHSVAFVSAPPENPDHKHPSKKVTNAFRRRGYSVHATQGRSKLHSHNTPGRVGWEASTPLPFHPKVEDDGDDS